MAMAHCDVHAESVHVLMLCCVVEGCGGCDGCDGCDGGWRELWRIRALLWGYGVSTL